MMLTKSMMMTTKQTQEAREKSRQRTRNTRLSTQTIERQAIKLLDCSMFCCLSLLVHDDADRSSNKIPTESHSFLLFSSSFPIHSCCIVPSRNKTPFISSCLSVCSADLFSLSSSSLFLWSLNHRQRGQRGCLQHNFTPQMLVHSEAQMYLSVYPRVSLSLHHHRSVFLFRNLVHVKHVFGIPSCPASCHSCCSLLLSSRIDVQSCLLQKEREERISLSLFLLEGERHL